MTPTTRIIQPVRRLYGEMTVPGDKSVSHRAVMFGAIAEGVTVVRNFLPAADCLSTAACMRQLGADIHINGTDVTIIGHGLENLREPDHLLDCGNSGTTMRLLTGLLSGRPFLSVLHGDESLRQRPMARVIQPLREMGAQIWARDNDRLSPLCVRGGRLQAMKYTQKVASAQVKSALLLAGLSAEGNQVIIEPTPSRDHTERLLPLFGVDIESDGTRIALGPNRRLKAAPVTVPGDISSAAYFMAMGCLIRQAEVTIKNVGVNPSRTGIIDILHRMQANVRLDNPRLESNEPVADIVAATSGLHAVEIGGDIIPRLIDELPILAIMATQAQGVTTVRDAGELRVKETDRIAAMVAELRKMGAKIEATPDGFIIEGPTPLRGAPCQSYHDHRIAMSLSVAGLIATGETMIENVDCIQISFPGFFDKTDALIIGRSGRVRV